jgi:hypothetical protein
MAKLYSQQQKHQSSKLVPKEETINFLLNYSKALSVIKYNKLSFNTLLN